MCGYVLFDLIFKHSVPAVVWLASQMSSGQWGRLETQRRINMVVWRQKSFFFGGLQSFVLKAAASLWHFLAGLNGLLGAICLLYAVVLQVWAPLVSENGRVSILLRRKMWHR